MGKRVYLGNASSWAMLWALAGCGSRTSLDGFEWTTDEHPATPGSIGGASARSSNAGAGPKQPGSSGGQSSSQTVGSGALSSGSSSVRPSSIGGRANSLPTASGGQTATRTLSVGGRSASSPSTMGGRVATWSSSIGGSTIGGRSATSMVTGGQNLGGQNLGGRSAIAVSAGGQRPTRPPLGGGNSAGGQSTSWTPWMGGNTSIASTIAGGRGGSTTSTTVTGPCPSPLYVNTGCEAEVLEGAADLCNDLDDDCDGVVDEGCPCTPGAVKPCFSGPPLRRNVGACRDGTQSCQATPDQLGQWGPCLGGIDPLIEVCDNLDNDCNGCRDEVAGCMPVGSCPGPSDPRIPELRPFDTWDLNAGDYYFGDARSYAWTIEGGPCDRVAPLRPTGFQLSNASSDLATFIPQLSGDYTITLNVQTLSGVQFRCDWVVPVRGPGLRIEMCYPESATLDLDLYLKRLSTETPWFQTHSVHQPNLDACAWANCEASLRGYGEWPSHIDVTRVDWGYANSPLSECVNGQHGDDWLNLGYCANPRLDIDNNLQEGIGRPENINIDRPRDGDGFRIMVQNYTGDPATPIVNVYCSGVRVATFGAPPDVVPNFASPGYDSTDSVGAMWRVADVTIYVDPSGALTCNVTGLHPAAAPTAYDVTIDDLSF